MYFRILLATAIALTTPTLVIAKPTIKVSTEYYEIDGRTRDELREEMRTKGPNGYFGWTNWYIRWTGGCDVSVEVTYTMPKLKSPNDIPAKLKESFDTFYAALLMHEENHGSHGISAANEIKASNCKNGNAIIDKWIEEDRKYDQETFHGQTEGVRLQ